MTKYDVLMMMEMTARAEQALGFLGYVQPPEHMQDTCRELVSEGLAKEHKGEPGWFMPTEEGAAKVSHRIHAVQ